MSQAAAGVQPIGCKLGPHPRALTRS